MSGDMHTRRLKIRRRTLVLVLILVLAVFVVFEAYAHTYVPRLSTVTRQDIPTLTYYINGTQTFRRTIGYASVEWVFTWEFRKSPSGKGTFYLYLFKVGSNGSLLVQEMEATPLELRTTSKGVYRENYVDASLGEVIYQTNRTVLIIEYYIGAPDTYDVNFTLLMKIYAKTLLGYLPIEDTNVSINVTMDYRP